MLKQMKIQFNIILTLVLVILGYSKTFSQDCFYYHEYFCKYPNSTYFYSGQSRSALFTNGMISEFRLVTFGGEDYHISICYERKFKNVRLRLLEDSEDRTVLYDNADFNYRETMTFSNNVARKIIVEISAPEDASGKADNDPKCVGVLIHFKKTYDEPKSKIGF